MTGKSQLKSIDAVIDAFGGITAMREIFGGVPTRFYNFKAKGKFPKYLHMDIYNAACERGLNIAPELIGMKKPERQGQLALQAAE